MKGKKIHLSHLDPADFTQLVQSWGSSHLDLLSAEHIWEKLCFLLGENTPKKMGHLGLTAGLLQLKHKWLLSRKWVRNSCLAPSHTGLRLCLVPGSPGLVPMSGCPPLVAVEALSWGFVAAGRGSTTRFAFEDLLHQSHTCQDANVHQTCLKSIWGLRKHSFQSRERKTKILAAGSTVLKDNRYIPTLDTYH